MQGHDHAWGMQVSPSSLALSVSPCPVNKDLLRHPKHVEMLKREYFILQFITGALEDLGGFGSKELRDGVKE